MTDGPDEPPWSPPTAEEQAEYARRETAADHRYHHVPARDLAERAEYDWQEAAEAAEEEAGKRFIHFYGIHVQDPNVAHGDCVDDCPYDTPEQARQRAERRAYVEAREAEYTPENPENNGGKARTGRRQQYGARPEDHAPPPDRRPPAEPGHDGPVPRM